MTQTNTLFSKILQGINRRDFIKVVDRYQGDKHVRTLRCWDQLVLMLFGQINASTSARHAIETYNSFSERLYHVGSRCVSRSTLCDANSKRDYRIFEDLFYLLVEDYQKQFSKQNIKDMITAIDATQIFLPNSLNGVSQRIKVRLHLKFIRFTV